MKPGFYFSRVSVEGKFLRLNFVEAFWHLQLKEERDSKLYFGFNWPGYFYLLWNVFVYFLGVLLVLLLFERAIDWFPFLSGILIVYTVLTLTLPFVWSNRMTVDLKKGTVQKVRGWTFSPKEENFPLSALEGVVLKKSVYRKQAAYTDIWLVGLQFRESREPAFFLVLDNESHAYLAMEHFAKKIRIDAIDRNGTEETRTPWQNLDLTLLEKAQRDPVRKHHFNESFKAKPPLHSVIEVEETPDLVKVYLPPNGWNRVSLFIALTSLLATGLTLREAFLGPQSWFFSTFMVCLFLLMLAVVYLHSRIRKILNIDTKEIRVNHSVLDSIQVKVVLECQRIKEVSIKTSHNVNSQAKRRGEILIRTDQMAYRFGSNMKIKEQEWLCAFLKGVLSKS